MDFILKEQTELFQKIRTLVTNVKKEPLQRRTRERLNKYLADVEILWTTFEQNDDSIREKKVDVTNKYFQEEIYENTKKEYESAVVIINKFLESLEKDKHEDLNNVKIECKRINFRIERLNKFIQELNESFDIIQPRAHYVQSEIKIRQMLEDIQLNIEDLVITAEDKDENLIIEFTNKLNQVDVETSSIINKLQQASDRTTQKTIYTKPPKLEPISIPKFNGRFKEWTAFKNLFQNMIHNNKSLSDVEKLQYLRNYVEDEPLRMINHLQITSDNYNIAFQLITQRYDNSRKLVDTYLDIIFNHPIASSKSSNSIKSFYDSIQECLQGLEALDVKIESSMIIYLGLKKLDAENIKAFEEGLKNPKEMPTIEQFLNFLESRYLVIESVNDKKFNNFQKSSVNTNITSEKRTCNFCQDGGHNIFNCDKFQKLSIKERNNFVFKKRLCKNCLMHKSNKKCNSKYKCSSCNKQHHSLLHYSNIKMNKQENAVQTSNCEDNSSNKQDSSKITSTHVGHKNTVLLATALIYIRGASGRFEPFRALIDQGSQASLITQNAATLLDLPRLKSNTEISGLGANIQKNAKYKVYIEIRSHFSQKIELEIMAYVLPKLTGDLPNESISIDKSQWNNIILADPNFDVQGPIDLILGADVYSKIILQGMKFGNPTAFKTKLGWILNGPTTKEVKGGFIASNIQTINQVQTNISITEINDSMTRFWNIEEIKSTNSSNKDDIRVKIDIKRDMNGRYSMRLPFKNKEVKLGNSRNQALARFMHLENSLKSHPAKRLEYHKFMKEYLDLGHMRPIHVANPNQGYYIPHHAIWKKDNITTRLRVVFDASAKTSNGRSLNDELIVGPTIQENLTSILIRWRSYKYVFTADIEKMYRQILIDEKDQPFQKILWRFSPLEPIKEFCLTTVTYGTSSAPYMAIQALQQLADDECSENSTIKKIIKNDFYVDDLMSGAASKKEAMTKINKIIKITSKGCFSLRKWASNDNSLIDHLPENLKINSLLEIDNNDSIKTLGIWWNPLDDDFTYKIKTNMSKDKTKRVFLSNISRIFDPMGWIAPITIVAKIMMQELWTLKMDWDDELPLSFQKKWINFEENLPILEKIKIPRYLQTSVHTEVEIHGFCDASEKAYASVVYARVNTDQGCIINLIGSKTRVAPLNKEQSIPRLELCAAQLLSKHVEEIKNSLKFSTQTPTYYWSDSKITLAWIKGDSNRWKSFVAHRVAEINKLSLKNNWNYVGTKFNPADIASRGISSKHLINNELWWNGPNWLAGEWKSQIEEENFTTSEEISQSKPMLKVYSNEVKEDFNSIICRFSSMTKCIRVICYIRRWCSKKRGILTNLEINEAFTLVIKFIQEKEFEREIKLLKAGKTNQISNKFLQLNPFLDERNVMRVGGRLKNLQLTSLSKHPIILPSSHYFTKLLVEHAHKQTLHGGNQLTLAYIRQNYWIPNGKCLVRNIIHKCIRCHRLRTETAKQMMGNLPMVRITPAPAFTNTGLDYAGPISIKTSKGRGTKSYKGFIAVFVCLATRAIHLEAVSDLTTNAFLAAFKRFTARRGYCLNIYTDNGTTFVGANNDIKKEFQQFLKTTSKTAAELLSENTNWHFIPPGAPHFGGIWEAAVKSMKHHLKRVIGDQMLTFEELTTVLYQIEACLNSRPITPLSNDPSEIEALTPGHFLIGRPLIANPQSDISELKCCSRWQLLTKMVQQFWKRWSTEYLSTLQHRPKWMTKEQNLKIGDLVLIKEDNYPPLKWSMGRIIETHPGKDDIVRAVTLRGPNGSILKRAISKLCPLPIQDVDTINQNRDNINVSAVRQVNKEVFTQKKISTTDIQEKHTSIESNHSARNWMRGINIDQLKIQSQELKKKCLERETRKRKGPVINPHITAKTLILATTLMTCLFSSASTTSKYNSNLQESFSIHQFLHQPGIYFEEIGKMRFQRNEWNLIIYYDLKLYKDIIQGLHESMAHLEETCHQSDVMCNAIQIECQHLMFNIKTSDTVLQNSNKDYRMQNYRLQKRGLINGIGYIANELFGILDARSATKYESQIHELKLNENHLMELAKNHTSITDATLRLFSDTTDFIKQELQLLNDTIQREKSRYSYTSMVLKMIITMMRVKELQGNMLNIILDTHHGKFNPILLPPDSLAFELKLIRGHIPGDVIIPDIIDGNLADLYNMMTVKSRLTKNNIIFAVKIPLPEVELHEVFKLIPLPINYRNELLIIAPSSQYLIINIHRDHYYPLNNDELGLCFQTADNIRICKPHNPIYNIQSNKSKCEVALLNHKEDYFQLCTMHLHTKSSRWIQLSRPNSWIYAMDCAYSIDIVCNSRVVNSTILEGQGILYLSSGCLLKQNELTIAARNTITSEVESNFFPLVDSEKILKTKDKQDIKGLRISATDIQHKLNTLQQVVNQQRVNEEQSTLINNHDVHHYVMIYFTFLCSIIIFIYGIITQWNRIKQKFLNVQNLPELRPELPALRSIHDVIESTI